MLGVTSDLKVSRRLFFLRRTADFEKEGFNKRLPGRPRWFLAVPRISSLSRSGPKGCN